MKQMTIEHYVVGPIQTNCYFAINKATGDLLVIDPGASGERLAEIAKEKGYHPQAILLTHGHYDHVDGIADFKAAFPDRNIPVYVHQDEQKILQDAQMNLSGDMSWTGHKQYDADEFVKDHEKLSLAGFTIEALHTPGHTPGGCCYYIAEEQVLFSGDSLFCGSVGRTDFPGGSMSQLIRSVKEQCLTLPEETVVLPGHESTSTIGDEKRGNMFLQ